MKTFRCVGKGVLHHLKGISRWVKLRKDAFYKELSNLRTRYYCKKGYASLRVIVISR